MTKEQRQGFLFEPMRSNEEVLSIMRQCAEKASSPKFSGGRSSRNIGAWCTCTNCLCMPTEVENVCCSEIKSLRDKLKDKEATCVTNLFSFSKLCLDTEVLEVLTSALKDFLGESNTSQLTNWLVLY